MNDLQRNDSGPIWHPYMCPSCRGLFRAPENHSSELKCPLCHEVAFVPIVEEEDEEPTPIPALLEKRRRRRSSHEGGRSKSTAAIGWEELSNNNEDRHTRLERFVWAASIILLTLVGLVFAVLIVRDRVMGRAQNVTATVIETEQGQSKKAAAKSTADSFKKFTEFNMEQARENIYRFLTAPTVESYPSLIRFPDKVMPLVHDYYSHNPYQTPGLRESFPDGSTQIMNELISVNVLLPDYQKKAIAVQVLDDGSSRIDWESWVGYCERPWETFLSDRVQEETLVRVIVTHSNYFNFGFTDEKWRAYHLDRGPDEPVAYGYIPVDSPLHLELPSPIREGGTYILKVRFPDDAASPDQILITEVLAEGWVFPSSRYEDAPESPTPESPQ